MRYPLSRFTVIPEEARARLANAGITDTDALLSCAALPAQRKQLAAQTGLSSSDILTWAGIADLVRVKGIGPTYATLLVQSGVATSLQGLLENLNLRMPSQPVNRGAVDAVMNRLQGFAPEFHNLRPNTLFEIASEAVELRPRLVIKLDESIPEFIQKQRREAREKFFIFLRTTLALIAVVVIVTAVGSLVQANTIFNTVVQHPAENLVETIYHTSVDTIIKYTILSTVDGILMMMLAALFVWAVYQSITWFMDSFVLPALISRPAYQKAYEKITIGFLQSKKGLIAFYLGLGLLGIIAGIETYFSITENYSIEKILSDVQQPFTVIGLLVGIGVSLPTLYFLFFQFRQDVGIDSEGIRRYLIFRILEIALIPVVLVFGTKAIIEVTYVSYNYSYLQWIAPLYERDLRAFQSQVDAVNVKDINVMQTRSETLATYDRLIDLARSQPLTETDYQGLKSVIGLIQSVSYGMVMAAIIGVYIIPYFRLGGLWKGIYYAALLAIAFWLENWLQTASPTWFNQPLESFPAKAVIAVTLLSSALLFDWLYDAFTNREKDCPGCGCKLSEEAHFCSECGLIQP